MGEPDIQQLIKEIVATGADPSGDGSSRDGARGRQQRVRRGEEHGRSCG
jgi:hypothetical protein